MDFEALFAKRASHVKPGLERMQRSYNFLGRPAASIPTVLVGGTNGKGSTSGFLWSLFKQNLGEFALYSSPHLIEFSERFQLSKEAASEADIADLWRTLKEALPSEMYEELSFFEIATLIAFQLFEAREVKAQVLEVGLGGRWDATNICDPMVSVLTSVSRDHEEYLGSDIKNILKEKLGIMRAGRPLFWADSGEICEVEGYRDLILDRARELKTPIFQRHEHFFIDADMLRIQLPRVSPLRLPLVGIWREMPEFLKNNLALAAAVYHYLSRTKLHLGLKPLVDIWSRWCEGDWLSPVTLLGRSQKLSALRGQGRQDLIVDVCHNPDGAKAFMDSLHDRDLGMPIPGLVSVLRDKDFNAILDTLRSELHPVILFGIDHQRSWDPTLLAARHQDLAFYPNLAAAWEAMQAAQAGKPQHTWALCGSVLAVGKALEWLEVSPKDVKVARVVGGDW